MSPREVTRRTVIVGSGALTVTAVGSTGGVLPSLLGTASAAELPAATTGLRASVFEPLVGQTFTFTARGAGKVRLVLDAVDAVAGRRTDTTFALRFSGPAAAQPGGELGVLRGPDQRPQQLLVVPSGRARRGRQDWVATVVGDALG